MSIFLFLCLTILYTVADSQQKDGGITEQQFETDLQDFVHRLTQQRLQGVTQQQRQFLRPDVTGSGDNSKVNSYASSFASVKRPFGGSASAQSEAVAYASVKDVNNEERLGEDLDYDRSSTAAESEKSLLTSPDQMTSSLSGQETPFTLKRVSDEVTQKEEDSFSDVYFVAIVSGCCAVGIFGVISAGFCFYKLQKSRKAAADVDYPAYGVTGPCKDVTSPNGDRKLAQSAQMYHYQHQKQQMIAVEKAGSTKNTSASDVDSEEENEEGDYTVYECPGLAPAGEMEVKNPLFHDDSTPVSPPVLPHKSDSLQSN